MIVTLEQASEILKKGGIVAYPTETFYGLAVDPTHEEAIHKIYHVKKRDQGKPISLILAEKKYLDNWVENYSPKVEKLIDQYWPGPLTIVFKAKKNVSSILTAKTEKIAIRISPNKIATLLAKNLGGAITATSANLSGKNSIHQILELRSEIESLVDGIIDQGDLALSKGSTIIDVTTDPITLLRNGEIDFDSIDF